MSGSGGAANIRPADTSTGRAAVEFFALDEMIRTEDEVRRLLTDVFGFTEVEAAEVTAPEPDEASAWDALIASAPVPPPRHNIRNAKGRFIPGDAA